MKRVRIGEMLFPNRREKVERRVVAEMIGRGQFANATPLRSQQANVDYTLVDYYFYDRLRRGKQAGYQLGGLFVQPIGEIVTAWILGSGLKIKVTSDTERPADTEHPIETAVNADLFQKERATLFGWLYDSFTLGDSYLAVNPDASLTAVMPSQVKLTTDPVEWRKVIELEIQTTTNKATILDRYTATNRTIAIKQTVSNPTLALLAPPSTEANTTTYTNLIGMIPVVHLPCDREANELTGHPMVESLLKLFAEYNDVVQKSLNGVKAMGQPLPVVEGSEDPDSDLARLSTADETYTDADDTDQTRPIVDFTQLSMLFLGKGAAFKFAAPPQFTQDAGRMLEYLFLLMLQHTKIPEWVWGGAVASSKASVDAQTPAFYNMIEGRRSKLEDALLQLVKVWLAIRALTDPALQLAEGEGLAIEWPELSVKDEKMAWEKAIAMKDRNVITDQKFVELSGEVADPAGEVEKAKAEAQANQDDFDQRLNDEIQRAGNEPPPATEPDDEPLAA